MVNSSDTSISPDSSSISLPSVSSVEEEVEETKVATKKVKKKRRKPKRLTPKRKAKKRVLEVVEEAAAEAAAAEVVAVEVTPTHRNRNALINVPLKDTNTLLLFVRMHGGLFPDETTGKCVIERNPFEVLFRHIVAAPGEYQTQNGTTIEKLQTAIEALKPLELTPKNLSETVQRYIEVLRDVEPLMLPAEYLKEETLTNELNIGFHMRNHRLINYHLSPYCMKIYSYNKVIPTTTTTTFHYGIYCMNKVKNGWNPVQNILFDPKLINWVKSRYVQARATRSNPSSYEIKDLQGTEYLHSITNNILFEYIRDELKIKRVFIIDTSCENDYFDDVKATTPVNLVPVKEYRPVYIRRVTNKKLKLEKEMNDMIATSKTGLTLEQQQKIDNLKIEIEKLNEIIRDLENSANHNRELSDAFRNTKKHVDKLKILRIFGDSDDGERSEDIIQDITKNRRNFYQQSKLIFPAIRKTKKFQKNAKQNIGNRWNVVKVDDTKYR